MAPSDASLSSIQSPTMNNSGRLRMPLSSIIADAEHLTKDAGVIEDYQATDNRETSSDHENIDIDAWADRIKAEDSIHNN